MTDRRMAWALGAVALLAAVLAGYYWVHKPVTPDQARALARSTANLGITVALSVLAGAAGRRLRLGPAAPREIEASPGEAVTLDVALGWGLGALAVLALGLAQLLHGWLFWILAAVGLALLRREARAWLRNLRAALRAIVIPDRPARLAAAFVLLLLGLALLRALAPPVMWDALVYHLTLPKLYVQANSLNLPTADFSLFTGMPQVSEMLYTTAALLRGSPAGEGAIAAQVLGWGLGAFLVLAVISLAHELRQSGIWAAAILLSSFTVAQSFAWAYGDLPLVLFAVAMLMALRRWQLQRELRWLILAGVYGGLAWGCKYTGGLVPMGGAVVAGVVALQRPGSRGRWRQAAQAVIVVGAAAGCTFAPWLVKNWIFTGSPVYPLLWPAADMDAGRQWFYSRPDLAERGPLAVLIFARATFLGVQGGERYDATLGPLYLLLPAMLVMGWRQLPEVCRRGLGPLLVFAGIGYLGWVGLALYSALAAQARLFFALLPALAILGAAGLTAARQLDTTALRLSVVLNGVLGLVLALSAWESGAHFVSQSPLAYLAGWQSASGYRADRLGWYEPALAAINRLPGGSRVVFLWETRSLACAAHLKCDPDVAIDRWWHLRRTIGSAPAIMTQWQAAGATHVLLYEGGAQFVAADGSAPFEPADWGELDRLRALLVPVETFGSVYQLYALP